MGETTSQVAWRILAQSHPMTELDVRRMRREMPCRDCRGSTVIDGGPDWFGNYESCPSCDGTGVEGGI